jgi:sialate O-acetylesterase
MVQLPRIKDARSIRAHWPEFREVQAKVAAKMTNVFNCVTIDLGTADTNVHPPDKRPVAERLANLIRQKIYSKKIAAESPSLERWSVKGDTLTVWFRNGAGLAITDGTAPGEFQIASGDGQFHPANAAIRADGGVDLKSPEVAAPVSARYCWAVFVTPNLVNAAGLPVAPFRTENFKSQFVK